MAFAPVFQRVFPAMFDRRAAAAASGNGLLNALIAYWPGNEASGNLLDAHTNGLHLTDANTVSNAGGKVYATARQYTAANSEYHTRNSEALLQTGNVDFTIAGWVYLDTSPAVAYWCSKYTAPATAVEYGTYYLGGTDKKLVFFVGNGGGSVVGSVTATAFGALATGAWYHVVCWHDATTGDVGIDVNGVSNTAARSSAPGTGAAPFRVSSAAPATSYWNGRIGPVAFWKSAAGAGGVLSSSQRSALYNGGAGLAYANFTT